MAGLKQFVLGLIRKSNRDLIEEIGTVSERSTENENKIGDVDIENDGDLQQQVTRKSTSYIESTLVVDNQTSTLTDGSKPAKGDLIFDKPNTTLWFVRSNGDNLQIKLL